MSQTYMSVTWVDAEHGGKQSFDWEIVFDEEKVSGSELDVGQAVTAAWNEILKRAKQKEFSAQACQQIVDQILGDNVVPFPDPAPYFDHPMPLFRVLD